jgi:hypothetical protein
MRYIGMETNNDTLSPQQSLDLITAMINQAKGNVRNNSFFFLFWGWVIVIAHIGSFSLQQIDFDYPYAVWLLVIPFAWVVTVVYSIRQARKTKSSTHIDKINRAVWISFGIVAITIPFIGQYVNYQIDALILLAGSIATTTSGFILKFRPLIIGGVVIYVCGIVCFVIPAEFRPLVAATAIAIGYLLPGYLLKRQA